ncbi:MAG: hypothetical protein BGO98_47300 [Myxococcales bacterium 68-20]|nr:hypothetical protein [Myxococcales bacterium]OJY29468.1 MAG: hypothetical protein BGO98_47300 [Myxococcales bacterium 68-20]
MNIVRLHSALFAGSASFAVAIAAVACSSTDDRPRFDDPLDAASDAPNLPETSPPLDGAVDARPPFDPTDEPVTCSVTPCATELAAGKDHFCARMSDGTARCWGNAEMGATGAGELDKDDTGGPPTVVAGLSGVTQISAAEQTSCARLDDSTIHCWGANEHGQLGLSADPPVVDDMPHPAPERVDILGAASRVDVGVRGACAVLASGEAWCWGANDRLQLARTSDDVVAGPAPAGANGLVITRTGMTSITGFGLTADNRLLGWGAISGREGSLDPDPTPFPLPSLHDVTAFAASATHVCAIANGAGYCWGSNRSSSLCSGLPDHALLPSPTSTKGSAYPQRIAVSERTTCVRMTDGTVQCCGDDTFGQLGSGKSGGVAPVFVRATAFKKRAVQIVTSSSTTCALVDDGSVECWGGNAHGELGQGTRDDDSHPTPMRVAF